MINDILTDVLIFSFGVVLCFVIDFRKSIKYWYVLLLFLIIGLLDNFFHSLTIHYPNLQIIESHSSGNQYLCWSGKLYSIVFVLISVVLLRKIITLSEIAFTIRQNNKSIRFSLIFVLIFIILASTFGLLSGKTAFDSETLLFMAIMPGLNEEFIYRGLLLGLLNKIFKNKFRIFKTNFGWGAIITSMILGILYGFQVGDNFQVHLDYFTILISGVYGFLFALIRERSGSLVFPVIAHSAADFFNYFFRMI